MTKFKSFKVIPNTPTWEDCGLACQENQQCQSWKWNVPDNKCAETGCKTCELHDQSISLSDTKRTKSWISGTKSCYFSLSSDCLQGSQNLFTGKGFPQFLPNDYSLLQF